MSNNLWEKETNEFIFFHGGVLSNWFKSSFYSNFTIDGELYMFNCSEQYMMAMKAHIFGDEDIKEEIMSINDPRKQKELGRKVKNFDNQVWLTKARDVVYNACFDKFYQNDKLFSILLSTEKKIIAEASSYDNLWGIGLSYNDHKIHWPNQWCGKNWLGQVLMKVRSDLADGDNNCFEEINWNETYT